MQNMFDLVLCTNGLIYKAPPFSGLEKGSEVIVESSAGMGEIETNVDCAYSIDPNTEEACLLFILRVSKTMTPLKKVLKKVQQIELKYCEEEKTDDHL